MPTAEQDREALRYRRDQLSAAMWFLLGAGTFPVLLNILVFDMTSRGLGLGPRPGSTAAVLVVSLIAAMSCYVRARLVHEELVG